jgi:hypothetical protein
MWPALAWAGLLIALAVMLALWTDDLVAVVLLPGAIVVTLVVALASRRARDPAVRSVPEASVSGVLGACGLTALAVGAVAGLWAALIGAGLLLLALIAAVRERWG